MVDDNRCPYPNRAHGIEAALVYDAGGWTPAVADILQSVGALAVCAADRFLTNRMANWNYRRASLSDGFGMITG